MTRMVVGLVAAALAAVLATVPASAQNRVKIGVLNDQSGPYSDTSGPGSVVAAQIAVDEFRATHPGLQIELVSADHQNKPDVGTGIARQWYDEGGVDAIVDIQNSAVALAVQHLAAQVGKVSIVTGAVTPELSGKGCSPTGVFWAMDAYSLAAGPVQALADKKKWFFITVDLAGGLLFEREGEKAVNAAGGTVIGRVRHPLGSPDMSAYLLQAQSAGAEVIALANAGADLINSIKGANEFGLLARGTAMAPLLIGANEFGLLARGTAMAPLLMFDTDVKAVGFPLAQGMVIGTGFYWDLDDRTRAFAKLFADRFKRMPTQYQASVYAATRHYLKAVDAAGTTEGAAVLAKFRELPIDYMSEHPGHTRPDGRVTYDVYVMQVKTSAESKGEWDLMRRLRTIPAESAFRPLSESECPLINKAG